MNKLKYKCLSKVLRPTTQLKYDLRGNPGLIFRKIVFTKKKNYHLINRSDHFHLTGSKNKKSKASIMRKLRGVKSLDSSHPDDNAPSSGLTFRELLGVKLRRVRRDSQKAGDGVCLGLELYVYDKKGPNRYKDRTLVLGHPSEDICVNWMERIQRELAGEVIFIKSRVHREKKQSQRGVQAASRMTPLFRGAQVLCDSLK